MFKKLLYGVAALSFIVLLKPSYTWNSFLPGIAIILFSFILFLQKGKKNIPGNGLLLLLLFFINLYNLRDISVSSLLSFLIILVYISSNKIKLDVYYYCKTLYAILLTVSIIVFILVVYVGIDIPYYIIDATNESKRYDYFQYPLLLVANDPIHPVGFFRFHFFFDEPGVVGTIAAIIMLMENYSLKKWQNIAIFISGLLSLSLFFIIISFFFLLVFKIRSTKGIFTLFLVSVVIGAAVWYVDENYFGVSELIGGRLEFENGKLAGDTRSNDTFDRVYDSFIREGDGLLFGKGVEAHARIAPGIQTYKMIIYDNGIVYFILVISFYLLFAVKELNKYRSKAFLYILFWLALYYQRPAYVFEVAYFYLLTLVPCFWKDEIRQES